MLAHLLTFIGAVVPLGNLASPFLVGLLMRNSGFVRSHARSAFVFQLSVVIYLVALVVLGLAVGGLEGLPGTAVALGLILAAVAGVALADVALTIRGAMRACAGLGYRYPLTLWFLRRRQERR